MIFNCSSCSVSQPAGLPTFGPVFFLFLFFLLLLFGFQNISGLFQSLLSLVRTAHSPPTTIMPCLHWNFATLPIWPKSSPFFPTRFLQEAIANTSWLHSSLFFPQPPEFQLLLCQEARANFLRKLLQCSTTSTSHHGGSSHVSNSTPPHLHSFRTPPLTPSPIDVRVSFTPI
ncbi:hypothetical protein BSKO_10475 [Bryopsis sp. KO-2023]|nr:hypothetical protein BSKO_10475 [Bryopsis sp. KO-2023]